MKYSIGQKVQYDSQELVNKDDWFSCQTICSIGNITGFAHSTKGKVYIIDGQRQVPEDCIIGLIR